MALKMNFVKQNLYSKEKTTPLGIALNAAIAIFFVLLLCELAFSVVFVGFYIQEDSMLPTLNGANEDVTGDYIFVNRFAKPDYFDIVIVNDDYSPNSCNHKNIVKRVVAFGGDTVKFEDGVLWLKRKGETEFTAPPEPYVDPDRNTQVRDEHGNYNHYYNYSEHVVKEGHMFLVGDNRNVSSDSRNSLNGNGGDYSNDNLLGVVSDWSMQAKPVTSSWYVFINKTLPEFFGFESELKSKRN